MDNIRNTPIWPLLRSIQEMKIDHVRSELIKHPPFKTLSKDEVLNRLNSVFDSFVSSGDKFLYAELGMCNGTCFARCKGYTFIGNHSQQFIHLIFEADLDTPDFVLLDILECRSFLNYNSALELKEKSNLHFFEIKKCSLDTMPQENLKPKQETIYDEDDNDNEIFPNKSQIYRRHRDLEKYNEYTFHEPLMKGKSIDEVEDPIDFDILSQRFWKFSDTDGIF